MILKLAFAAAVAILGGVDLFAPTRCSAVEKIYTREH